MMRKFSSAVCIAHPGHELLIYGWLRRELPLVFVFTDGSGHDGQSRLGHSRRLLEATGVALANGCGRFTDRQAYELILDRRVDLLMAVVQELTAQFVELGVRTIIADAAEGYNPVHDLIRMLVGAVRTLAALEGIEITHHEFAIADHVPVAPAACEISYRLRDAELEEKVAAALEYAPLQEEVTARLNRFGSEALRTEVLRHVPDWLSPPAGPLIPHYERVGEERCSTGRYRTVIRYADHFQPLQRELMVCLEKLGAHSHHQRNAGPSGRHAGLHS